MQENDTFKVDTQTMHVWSIMDEEEEETRALFVHTQPGNYKYSFTDDPDRERGEFIVDDQPADDTDQDKGKE